MRRMAAVFVHPNQLQRLVHAAADLLGGNPEILRRKGDVLLDHVGDHLVVRVLKDHAHRPADLKQQAFVLCVHAKHRDASALRQKNRIHMLGQRRFPTAVASQNRHKTPSRNVQRQAGKHGDRRFPRLGGIGKA